MCKMWMIIALECGSCGKTNEDMYHRHCHICGMPCPVRYYVVGDPIEPDCGRRWFGTAANPINEEQLYSHGNVPSLCYSTNPSPALSSITTISFNSSSIDMIRSNRLVVADGIVDTCADSFASSLVSARSA